MNNNIKKITLSAMFIAIGLVLPFFTGQIKQIGNMLLPMHIPVFLCGLICGWQYGMVVGLCTPVVRSAIFLMPHMFPNAIAMSFELATYGAVVGLVYKISKQKNIASIYKSMIVAMISGRAVWGVVMLLFMGIWHTRFSWQIFLAGAFLNAVPGIILQLILIPAFMLVLDRTKTVCFSEK